MESFICPKTNKDCTAEIDTAVMDGEVNCSSCMPPECRECGKWNGENCNTCPVINPQYDGV